MAKIISFNDSLSFNDIIPVSRYKAAALRAKNLPVMHGALFEVNEFGKPIFKRWNTVTLGGSQNALEKLTGKFFTYRPQSRNVVNYSKMICPMPNDETCTEYNEGYEQTIDGSSHILLFGVGDGGAGNAIGDVYAPDFRQSSLNGWLPFRVAAEPTLDAANILYGGENAAERSKYHFLLKNDSQPIYKYEWYLKEFESEAELKSLWKNAPDLTKDGTEIMSDSDVVNGPAGVGIECLAEFVLTISEDDIYPFFQNSATTSTARFNTIGLFSASLMTPNYELAQNLSDGHSTAHLSADGYKEAYNTRLFSVVTFDNVSLREQKQSTYIYRVYASL